MDARAENARPVKGRMEGWKRAPLALKKKDGGRDGRLESAGNQRQTVSEPPARLHL